MEKTDLGDGVGVGGWCLCARVCECMRQITSVYEHQRPRLWKKVAL